MSNKKILFVMPSLNMGGAEKSFISVLRSLDYNYLHNNNLSIEVLVLNDTGALMKDIPKEVHVLKPPYVLKLFSMKGSEALEASKIKIDVLLLKGFWKFMQKKSRHKLSGQEGYWSANKKFINKLSGSYDVCFAYMNGLATYYAIDKISAKKKYIWVHNDYNALNYHDEFEDYYMSSATEIITISERCANSIARHFPKEKKKIHVIENITSSKMLKNLSMEYFPKEYANVKGQIILSIGRLTMQKGFDIGVRAMELLKKRNISFVWFVIGEGEEQENLRTLIEKLGVAECVKLIGLKENPYPYIKNCDIFFQPSRYEGKSVTIDEAKMFCKPIVVANYPTVLDSLENGRTAIICNGDPVSLCDGVEQLCTNSTLKEHLSVNLSTMELDNETEIDKFYIRMGLDKDKCVSNQ